MNTGWIKIYRSLLYWEWADVPEMVALWVRLIIRATHEDSQWHGVTISRGQLVTTTAKLAAESGLSPQQVRTCLDRLKASNQINTQTTNKDTCTTTNSLNVYKIGISANQLRKASQVIGTDHLRANFFVNDGNQRIYVHLTSIQHTADIDIVIYDQIMEWR